MRMVCQVFPVMCPPPCQPKGPIREHLFASTLQPFHPVPRQPPLPVCLYCLCQPPSASPHSGALMARPLPQIASPHPVANATPLPAPWQPSPPARPASPARQPARPASPGIGFGLFSMWCCANWWWSGPLDSSCKRALRAGLQAVPCFPSHPSRCGRGCTAGKVGGCP